MRDAASGSPVFDTAAISADAVALAELDGGTGHEQVRIDWLLRRLADAPGSRHVDGAGNLVWTFGPAPYRLAVLAHVDDVFGEATERGVTERDGWLCGPGIGDNAIAVATAVAVCEHGGRARWPWSSPSARRGSAGYAGLTTPAASWPPRRCWPWRGTVPTACSPRRSARCGCGSR